MDPIYKYGITLRPVEKSDAAFIINLRTDSDLGRFISPTSPNIQDQVKWIQDYKQREKSGSEYYFIAQDQPGNRYGTIRLYNLDDRSFEIGSWLFRSDSPMGMAVKAHFIGFEFGFEFLKKEYARFEIRKENKAVLRYMKDFITTLVREDALNYYFTLSKENFYIRRNQLSIFAERPAKPVPNYQVHPTSEVKTKNIGKNTTIWQNCVVLKDAVIGENCNLNYNVFVENDVVVGNNVTIKSGVQLWDGIRIEDDVFISPNVTFTNDFAPRSKMYPQNFLKTLIKKGASIGANSTIIGGIVIGSYAMIGAGSVVTKNIPDYTLWYGVPAQYKANVCSCGQKLNNDLVCSHCKKKYRLVNGNITEL
jgi:acetyltransferase-like isoleucine patch superfamily enzyme/RimJ/RimL family protein N-acetyltransferase